MNADKETITKAASSAAFVFLIACID